MNKYLSRKFLAASLVQAVSSVALFTGHLSGGEWIAAASLALGIYGAANVANKRAQQ